MNLDIVEYGQNYTREWDSIAKCAKHHHMSVDLLKRVIYYGGSVDGKTFFDVALHSEADIRYENGKFVVYEIFKPQKYTATNYSVSHAVRHGSLCLPDGITI